METVWSNIHTPPHVAGARVTTLRLSKSLSVGSATIGRFGFSEPPVLLLSVPHLAIEEPEAIQVAAGRLKAAKHGNPIADLQIETAVSGSTYVPQNQVML
jgi:hypothetical protein